jgi:hypothetical protein
VSADMLLRWTGSDALRAQAALLLESQGTVWFAAAACLCTAAATQHAHMQVCVAVAEAPDFDPCSQPRCCSSCTWAWAYITAAHAYG